MVKVLGDRVLLQQLPRDKFTRDGKFLLSERYREEQQIHRVLALGTACKAPLKLGDLVLVDQYSINSRTFVEDGPEGSSLWILATEHLNIMVSYEQNPPGFTPLVSGFAPRHPDCAQAPVPA